nr:MAG TPA: hypothetical protein [Caudoviricetes sp.]
MIKALEKHQNKKCLECPYHWSDGMYSEHGCYIEEGRLGKFWQRLTEMLCRAEYSGCFIPSFVLKALYIIQDIKNRRRYEKYLKEKMIMELKIADD